MKRGDVCRARCSAPARYLRDGQCVFVSSMGNELCLDEAVMRSGGEERFPLPSDEDLDQASDQMAKGVKP